MNDRSLPSDFMRHVEVIPNGHWWWTGALHADGYGLLAGKAAHRIAWTVFRGPIPPRRLVHRSCGQYLCVNPDHLHLSSGKASAA
jgi:hypothetical protein